MVSDVDDRGGHACIGAGDIWENSVPSSEFYWEFKTALRNSL